MNVLVLSVFVLLTGAVCSKRKYIHPVDDEQYPILHKLASGKYRKAVNERSKKERTAVVKFWRAKGKFKVKDGVLMYDEKQVSVIKTFFI